jgi:RimJ/RimL family protein N-acetyltransferase
MVTAEVPAIDTDRLSLRGHRVHDLHESAAMWGNPEVTRHIGGRPFSQEEVWTRLLRHVGHWSLLGFGTWVVREKSSGRFVGEVGFADYRRDIQPSFHGTPELGWVLDPWAHGRGFALEAASAALAWGESRFGAARTVCIIRPENVRSIRLAEKLGYKLCANTAYKGQPILLFER